MMVRGYGVVMKIRCCVAWVGSGPVSGLLQPLVSLLVSVFTNSVGSQQGEGDIHWYWLVLCSGIIQGDHKRRTTR